MVLKREENGKESKALFQSSNILEAKYSVSTASLVITFTSGRQYKYDNVARYQYSRLLTAESVGKAFNKHIVKDYKAERLDDVDVAELKLEVQNLIEEQKNGNV